MKQRTAAWGKGMKSDPWREISRQGEGGSARSAIGANFDLRTGARIQPAIWRGSELQEAARKWSLCAGPAEECATEGF